MSTLHHSPHTTGFPLTSALLEAPHGELDAAIETLSDAIDAVVIAGTGTTTTLDGAAASGQKVIPLTATTGITAGQTFFIAQASGVASESGVVGSVSAGVSVTAVANLVATYATGDVFSLSPAEIALARGGFDTLEDRLDAGGVVLNLVADGATDNAPLIQAAHDALPVNGGTIWLRNPGIATRVMIGSTITISKTGVHLVGVGLAGLVIKAAAGFTGSEMILVKRTADFANGYVDLSLENLQLETDDKGIHGITICKAQDFVYLHNVRVNGVSFTKNAFRITPDPDYLYNYGGGNDQTNEVSQGLIAIGCHGYHTGNPTGGTSAPTWYVERLQESQFLNCGGWGGTALTSDSDAWHFVDCRGVQVRGGSASASKVGIRVTSTASYGSVGVLLDGVTFETIAMAVRAEGVATMDVSRLTIRSPRFEGTVTDGAYLRYTSACDVDMGSKSVDLDATAENTMVWTDDYTVVDGGTISGTATTVIQRANQGSHAYPTAYPGWNALTGYQVLDTAVVGTRKTGWTAATGTAARTTFATSTVTTEELAKRVKALVDDLISHGLIGS